MKTLFTVLAITGAALAFNVSAASISSSVTQGWSNTTQTVHQATTGSVEVITDKVTKLTGDFDLDKGHCRGSVCDGVGDVDGSNTNVVTEHTEVVVSLDQVTTGVVSTDTEWCETSFTVGDVTTTAGISKSESYTDTLTVNNNVTTIAGVVTDVVIDISETVTITDITVIDTGFSETESWSETTTIYSSVE